MIRNYSFRLLLPAALLLLGACGTARRSEPFRGPMEYPSSDVAQGHVVYKQYCQPCHPGGEAGLGPSINDKPLPGFLIKFQVRHGMGAMPAFKEEVIPDEQLRQMVKYMMALKKNRK